MADKSPEGKRKRSPSLDKDESDIAKKGRKVSLESNDQRVTKPSPEPSNEELIEYCKSSLREHIGADPAADKRRQPVTPVLFFLELSPSSSRRGAACKHVTCTDRIEEDSYRIAVSPGMSSGYCYYQNPDFYHVKCFEELADFSQSAYLKRLTPVTRLTADIRGLKGTSVADGNYLLDGGAERLVLEWKTCMEAFIRKRDGVSDKPLESDFDDLLHKAGSAAYRPKQITGMPDHEFFLLSRELAPIESDGVDDKDEWNLFEQYISLNPDDGENSNKPCNLSDSLKLWSFDNFLACADEKRLSDYGKEQKKELGDKAIRAIKRLSSIPMPNFRALFFGRSG